MSHKENAAEELDKAMRKDKECDKRLVVVTDKQYHALGSMMTETYDSRSAALFRLLRTRLKNSWELV